MNSKYMTLAAIALFLASGCAMARPPQFDTMDADGNGSVTRAEAEKMIIGHAEMIDANNDGIITEAEMQTEQSRHKDKRPPRPNDAPAQFSGDVQLAEFVAHRLDRLMQHDQNGDGELSVQELAPPNGRGGPGGPR